MKKINKNDFELVQKILRTVFEAMVWDEDMDCYIDNSNIVLSLDVNEMNKLKKLLNNQI
jgi:hypothetical protein